MDAQVSGGPRVAKWMNEMFTIAETYIISIDEKASDHKTNIMLLVVELAIDTIIKKMAVEFCIFREL